jgi:hypothetical protein
MTLKKRIDDLSDRFESIEESSNTITGVLTRSEYETYQATGFTMGGCLILPGPPLTEEEWLARAQQVSQQQAIAGKEAEEKYGICASTGKRSNVPAEAPQRPYQEPHIHRNNNFGLMGRG